MKANPTKFLKSSTESLLELSSGQRELLKELKVSTVQEYMDFDFSQATLKPITQHKFEVFQKEIRNRIQIQQISEIVEPTATPSSNKNSNKKESKESKNVKTFQIDLSKDSYNPGKTLPLWRKSGGDQEEEPILVPWKSLDRHAFICGSTGSGKTVLLKSLLEQAAIHQIPGIVFDPGGDLGYLSLRCPWLDKGSDLERNAKELTDEVFVTKKDGSRIKQFVEDIAKQDKIRRDGGISKNYVQQLTNKTFVRILSPRSSKQGISTAIPPFNQDSLKFLEGESDNEYDDRLDEIITTLLISLNIGGKLAERTSTVLKILMKEIGGNLGANPLDKLLDEWSQVEKRVPTIRRIPLSVYLKKDDKVEFQRALINYLEGTGAGWLRGCNLDFDNILQEVEGKTPINVLYVGHLNLDEQQYVLARVSSELDKWMRNSATPQDKLKVLFAIDELGGSGGKESFFPPTAKPVSKPPLMRLVRQARKYGCGLVFATQNVKDIDYRGLGNISNWFVGQLKNAREHRYIGDGMGSSLVEGSQLDKREISHLLPALGQGKFVNIGADGKAKTFQAGFIGSLHLRPSQEFYEAWLHQFIQGSEKNAFNFLVGKPVKNLKQYEGFGYFEDALLKYLHDDQIQSKNTIEAWKLLITHSIHNEYKLINWLWHARDKMSNKGILQFCELEIISDSAKSEIEKIKALALLASNKSTVEREKEMPTFSKDSIWKKFIGFLMNWNLPNDQIDQWKIKTESETVRFDTKDLKSVRPVESNVKRRRELRKYFIEHIESLDKKFINDLFNKTDPEEKNTPKVKTLNSDELLKELAQGSTQLVHNLELRRACHNYLNSLSPDGFEFFIADLMRQFGWQAQLTRASGDDGVDVLCINEDGLKCAVQCKRYSKKVAVSTVRELEGAKVMYDCQEAILATTDEFTSSSFETAKKLNITLLDGDLLAFHAIPLLEPEKKI